MLEVGEQDVQWLRSSTWPFERLLLYSLIGFGVILIPSAGYYKDVNPIKCQICQSGLDNCPDSDILGPELEQGYVDAVCREQVIPFPLLNYPLVFLAVFVGLTLIRVAELGSETRIGLLSTFLTQHVIRKIDFSDEAVVSKASKDCFQIRLRFRILPSSVLSRINVQILIRSFTCLLAGALALLHCLGGNLPFLMGSDAVQCQVQHQLFVCAGQHRRMLWLIWILEMVGTVVYNIISLYNVLSITLPQFNEVYRVMNMLTLKLANLRDMSLRDRHVSRDTALMGTAVEEIYFENQELQILFNLFGSGHGLCSVFKAFSIFDEGFREELEPGDIAVTMGEKPYQVDVRVSDNHSLMKSVLNSISGISCIYMVEIVPSLKKKSVHVVEIEAFDPVIPEKDSTPESEGSGLIAIATPPTDSLRNFYTQDKKVSFEDLEPNISYSFRISTVMNGQEIAAKVAKSFLLKRVETSPKN